MWIGDRFSAQTQPFSSGTASEPLSFLEFEGEPLEAQQAHSATADLLLGLRIDLVERKLRERSADSAAREAGHEIWLDKTPRVFLTPYSELRAMIERCDVKRGGLIVDLGAGYGRLGFVASRYRPEAKFVGYELVPERAAEGHRALKAHGCKNAEMISADVAADDFKMPAAQLYFVYDFGSRQAIKKALEKLRQVALRQPISVIARGRSSRDAIERENPWLSQVVAPEHHGIWSLYRSSFLR